MLNKAYRPLQSLPDLIGSGGRNGLQEQRLVVQHKQQADPPKDVIDDPQQGNQVAEDRHVMAIQRRHGYADGNSKSISTIRKKPLISR